MHIALLHTAGVHVDTFDMIFAQLDPAVTLTHRVAPELLDSARAHGLDRVRAGAHAALADIAAADAVLCTCSTLGPLTAEFAAKAPHVLRIDTPLMLAACAHGPAVLVALCLDSTRDPTLALLDATAAQMGVDIAAEVLLCADAWPLFEAGKPQEFGRAVAEAVRARVARGGVDCVVLAQASMRVAERELADLGLPVLSSPELAAREAIRIARRRS